MSATSQADRPSQAALAAANPDALEVAPGAEHQKLGGSVPELATEEDLRAALEKAFDYRGDVPITLKNGSKVEGYVLDRARAQGAEDPCDVGVQVDACAVVVTAVPVALAGITAADHKPSVPSRAL